MKRFGRSGRLSAFQPDAGIMMAMLPPDFFEEPDDPLIMLTRVRDSLLAQILAARLEAEGIAAQLKGEFSGPYPFSVGSMAETEVWVQESSASDARLVLQEVENDEEQNDYESLDTRISTSQSVSNLWWLAAAVGLVAFLVGRGSLIP